MNRYRKLAGSRRPALLAAALAALLLAQSTSAPAQQAAPARSPVGRLFDSLRSNRGEAEAATRQLNGAPAAPVPPPAVERIPLPGPSPGPSHIPLDAPARPDDVQISGNTSRITLVVREQPVRRVLELLAQSQGLNIVAGDDVSGNVSITLRDVPLDDALNAILSVAGCSWMRGQGIIHVTRIGAGDLAPHIQGRRVEVFPLDYADPQDVADAVQGLLSPVGKVFVNLTATGDNRQTHDRVVVEDMPQYLERIAQYIGQVDLPPRQVLIEAHLLQVELQDDKRHGVNFEHMFSVDGNQITLEQRGFANPLAPQAFFIRVDGNRLTALVELLKTTTDAKTLASPKLLVLNGQEARLQVGQQLGFRVTTTTETSTLESVDFLDVGVVLRVVPRITSDNRVVLHVKPEVSSGEVNPDTGLPEEETTEVETDVMLDDGQGMVIGGLIQEKDTTVQQKVPFLGDVWLAGRLFQRSQVTKSRSEIIVVLVPRVVPFAPHTAAREAEHEMRAATPLLNGPLKRVPRPFEPQLYDAVRNPVWPRPHGGPHARVLPDAGPLHPGRPCCAAGNCQLVPRDRQLAPGVCQLVPGGAVVCEEAGATDTTLESLPELAPLEPTPDLLPDPGEGGPRITLPPPPRPVVAAPRARILDVGPLAEDALPAAPASSP